MPIPPLRRRTGGPSPAQIVAGTKGSPDYVPAHTTRWPKFAGNYAAFRHVLSELAVLGFMADSNHGGAHDYIFRGVFKDKIVGQCDMWANAVSGGTSGVTQRVRLPWDSLSGVFHDYDSGDTSGDSISAGLATYERPSGVTEGYSFSNCDEYIFDGRAISSGATYFLQAFDNLDIHCLDDTKLSSLWYSTGKVIRVRMLFYAHAKGIGNLKLKTHNYGASSSAGIAGGADGFTAEFSTKSDVTGKAEVDADGNVGTGGTKIVASPWLALPDNFAAGQSNVVFCVCSADETPVDTSSLIHVATQIQYDSSAPTSGIITLVPAPYSGKGFRNHTLSEYCTDANRTAIHKLLGTSVLLCLMNANELNSQSWSSNTLHTTELTERCTTLLARARDQVRAANPNAYIIYETPFVRSDVKSAAFQAYAQVIGDVMLKLAMTDPAGLAAICNIGEYFMHGKPKWLTNYATIGPNASAFLSNYNSLDGGQQAVADAFNGALMPYQISGYDGARQNQGVHLEMTAQVLLNEMRRQFWTEAAALDSQPTTAPVTLDSDAAVSGATDFADASLAGTGHTLLSDADSGTGVKLEATGGTNSITLALGGVPTGTRVLGVSATFIDDTDGSAALTCLVLDGSDNDTVLGSVDLNSTALGTTDTGTILLPADLTAAQAAALKLQLVAPDVAEGYFLSVSEVAVTAYRQTTPTRHA